MALVRYEPWGVLNQMQHNIDRMLASGSPDENSNVVTRDWAPAVDIKETETSFEIHADIPGVNPDEIEIHMDKGILSIKGERESETRDEKQGYKRVERQHGVFYRRFSLPDSANADKISAKSNHGVLEISIPKQDEVKPRKITVQS